MLELIGLHEMSMGLEFCLLIESLWERVQWLYARGEGGGLHSIEIACNMMFAPFSSYACMHSSIGHYVEDAFAFA